jgi:hypothetical protein
LLLNEARKLAAAERTTVRALVEEGLRQVVGRRRRRGKFRLRRASFRGKGLQAGVSDGSWERVREMIYEGRGA